MRGGPLFLGLNSIQSAVSFRSAVSIQLSDTTNFTSL